MSGHQRPYRGATDEWLTPPEIVQALGPFDLDPCSPIHRPWGTAHNHFTVQDDGLESPWSGRVWLNPPYGPEMGKWLAKLRKHGLGTALIFARTETRIFFEEVWPHAFALLFLKGRLHFYNVAGERAPFNSGAPSVLVAYGDYDARRLANSGLEGKFIALEGFAHAEKEMGS